VEKLSDDISANDWFFDGDFPLTITKKLVVDKPVLMM